MNNFKVGAFDVLMEFWMSNWRTWGWHSLDVVLYVFWAISIAN
jgi:hypothetical protein